MLGNAVGMKIYKLLTILLGATLVIACASDKDAEEAYVERPVEHRKVKVKGYVYVDTSDGIIVFIDKLNVDKTNEATPWAVNAITKSAVKTWSQVAVVDNELGRRLDQ